MAFLSYEQREQIKSDAGRVLRDPEATTTQKTSAASDIIEAHFARSAEFYSGKHPNFTVYARAYLADPYKADRFPADVLARFVALHGRKATPRLPTGRTYWTGRRRPSPNDIALAAILANG